MKYKKNQIIKNTCPVCSNTEMKIYYLKRNKNKSMNVEGGTSVFIWCECEECGAVDDLLLEESEYQYYKI